ncbi:pseudouridine synthase [Motiliproteus coralliicola]|uniref:Pseudouridine synthase n=1 Tax=Motiliproteus coralliicola TaxID=2283196 RepID=A0A369WPP9_9GAMM|nr:pseudouridine synthase [Motiliproteus coralliicola]RDE24050.1 pseudouridine synthase [Motiliproteus coralliicola]
MRLDRFLANQPQYSRRRANELLAAGRVELDDQPVRDGTLEVDRFSRIAVDGRLLQQRQARYFMLNKPAGILSATRDDQHRCATELIESRERDGLHIAGRLDRASTGLLLLSDDGSWTRVLTEPDKAIKKIYRVETANPIDPQTQASFAEGIYFAYEGITTKPVKLEQLGERCVRLTLTEGRYHQIKRMFGRFRNPVLALHREQIGAIRLDPDLAPGQYRPLTPAEIDSVMGR